jgi:serine/threonine-protein kinase
VLENGEVLAPGRRLGGRYRLERRLGTGGMATVWLATDERLGRPVAVKLLTELSDDDFARRFRREAKLAAGLHHPNLASVYDYEAGGRPYLVMEYVEGGSLADRLRAGDAPPAERLAGQLLAALSSIHAAGVLHRDVKPENVLLDRDGRARLVDFGIAQSRDGTSITRVGQVIGTETYMAPEVRSGEPATERSDLYSLGVLLAKVAEQDGESATTWTLIEALRDPDPDRRPHSATAALARLERDSDPTRHGEPTAPLALAGDAGPPPPVAGAPLEPAAADRRRRMLAAGALAAVVVALIAGIALAVGGGDDPGSEPAVTEAGGGSEKPADRAKPDKEQTAATPEGSGNTRADGSALNDQGHALIQSGQYEEAIPVLERAVQLLRESGPELTYNYALFNLAHALRMAGRPEEAIPLLEERLEYPDQQDVVAAELAAAREAAGIEDGEGGVTYERPESGGVEPGNGPPPWAEGGD